MFCVSSTSHGVVGWSGVCNRGIFWSLSFFYTLQLTKIKTLISYSMVLLNPRNSFYTCDKVSNGAKTRNGYNQVPHLTQDTNRKITNSQLYTTNESQEVSPFQAGDHKAHINRCAQRHNKHKTEQSIKNPQKKYCLGTVCKIFYWRAKTGNIIYFVFTICTLEAPKRVLL